MGEYEDFAMIRKNEPNHPIAGICHARGVNAKIPRSGWFTCLSKTSTQVCVNALSTVEILSMGPGVTVRRLAMP